MSNYYNSRRSRSPSWGHDEDADYQLALKMSAEWNGEQPAPPTHQPDYDADAEFALAMQIQYDNELQAAEERHLPPSNNTAWAFGSDSRVVEYNLEKPLEIKLEKFADFMNYLRSSRCKCGEQLFRSELDVNNTFQNWFSGKGPLSSWMKCRNCSISFCFACTPEAFVRPSTISYGGKQICWCCAGGRTLLIWILLCGFDHHFCEARTRAKVATKTNPMQQNQALSTIKTNKKSRGGRGFGGSHRHSTSSMPSGMGYGSNTVNYEGFDDYLDNPNPLFYKGKRHAPDASVRLAKHDSKSKAESAQLTEDNFNMIILELLKDLLPSLDRDAGFDVDPPEAVTDMLVNSKILNYCAELLRNDSLDDATKRRQLYHALLSFLQTAGMHVMANRTLFSERPVHPDTVNLQTLSFSSVQGESKEMASSLADNLRNLNTQSALVLQNAQRNEKDFYSDDGQNMLLLCRQISELSQHILAYTSIEPLRDAATCMADLTISDVPDDQILKTHTYALTAKSLTSSPPGRFKRLITEITTLKTGLPPGIFVRYCETRLDVLKVAIIGPRGTPYENGIFEFDFYCDAIYPNQPPSVSFKGTGGGRISINPNLYADGKVCLSLLGTWQGEPWKPGESTLLQVVISLQAMILCEEPWYNEPGREAAYHRGSGHNPAEAYNQVVREHTVRYAMLNWLDKPPQLWQAVVDHHFKANANQILQTANDWAKMKTPTQTSRPRYDGIEDFDYSMPSMGNVLGLGPEKGDISSLLPRLQIALQKFGATKVIQSVSKPSVPRPPMPPPPISYAMPSSPIIPPPLGPPPPYSATQAHFPPSNPGPQGHGSFWGLGRILGSEDSQSSGNAIDGASNNRESLFLGGPSDRHVRYETRSATGGRDGAAGLIGESRGGFSNTSPNPFPADLGGLGGTAMPGPRGDQGISRGSRRSYL